MSNPVSVAELRAYIGTDSTSDDPVLRDMLDRSLHALEGMLDRRLVAVQEVRQFHPVEDVLGDWLHLGDDVCEIVSVTNGDGTVLVAGTDYVPWPRKPPYWKLRAVGNTVWTWSSDPDIDTIDVDAWWGVSKTLSGEERDAVIKLAAFLYRQRDNVSDADRPIITPEGIVLMPARIPPEIQSFVSRNRKRRVLA